MSGKRYSRQRELIYEAVRASKEHPTAEMVYGWLRPENPNLSLGTVYRNLHQLSDEGALVRMPFPVERYDGELTPHSHFRCKTCGRVMDIAHPYDGGLDASAKEALQGFRVDGHDLVFSGLCPECMENA